MLTSAAATLEGEVIIATPHSGRAGLRNAGLAAALVAGVSLVVVSGVSGGETLQTADGRERAYFLVTPSVEDDAAPLPLVVLLHEEYGNPDTALMASRLDVLAEKEGFLLAVPQGSPPMERGAMFASGVWNVGFCCGLAAGRGVDDVAFIKALITRVSAEHPVDPRRIHLVGYRTGGALARRAACALPEVAAVAVVASSDTAGGCDPGRPLAALTIYGQDDPCSPPSGGPECGGCAERFGQALFDLGHNTHVPTWPCASVSQQLSAWRSAAGCTEAAAIVHDEPGVRCSSFETCSADVDVTACAVERHGHGWPGTELCAAGGSICGTSDRIFGPTDHDFDASAYIWRFLSANPRPRHM